MTVESAAAQFNACADLANVEPLGRGNVNDTYLATFRNGVADSCIVVQKINKRVFRNPALIVENMRLLLDHFARKHLPAFEDGSCCRLPDLVPASDGTDFFVDEAQDYWRALTVIDGAQSFITVKDRGHAEEVGAILGHFHRLVSDMDGSKLHDTLPGFHDCPGYLADYDEIVRSGQGRVGEPGPAAELQPLHDFVDQRRGLAEVLESALRQGRLLPRVIHGDPKVDNIMIDEASHRGVGIIDLDTLRAGLIHYDFGDALRSICNPAGEEAEDLGDVRFDLDLCSAFVTGYMKRARGFLTPEDHVYLYDSIRLLAFELGLRFFKDHLAGDVYFKVRSPGQNLHRARVQFKLCTSIEEQEPQIRRVLQDTSAQC